MTSIVDLILQGGAGDLHNKGFPEQWWAARLTESYS